VNHENHKSLHDLTLKFVSSIENNLKDIADKRTQSVLPKIEKILNAFSSFGLGPQHFHSVTGYGHGDIARELIDNVFATVFSAEKAAIRMQFVSGTHAISSVLFGVLRPGDTLLSLTGRPYDTLEEVIGLRGTGQGSLLEFGISYEEKTIFTNGEIDFKIINNALEKPVKMVFLQRSCGYSWRPSLSIENIREICKIIHFKQPDCLCFVDNCYGEFVEDKEPTEVGADIIAGSLIKNPGGTLVTSGGYIAGRTDLVEQACCRLTAPGIGSDGGTGFNLNRLVLQGLFLSPQMVSESLIGADLIAGVFSEIGFDVKPLPAEFRSDLIQAVCLGKEDILKAVCQSFQKSSPVSSYLNPIPASMPGYETDVIMAGGTFIDGSTSEFSADAPLRPPYNIFIQGGTHRTHIKIAISQAIIHLLQEGIVELPNI